MGELSIADSWVFCNRILVDVSRSFALIIPRCPPPIDRCLCVGYLLCRIADTIEDDERLTSAQRAVLYDGLLACVDDPPSAARCEHFISSWPQHPTGSYGELIDGTLAVLNAFESIPPAYREPIARCVHEMVAGMLSVKSFEQIKGIDFFCRDLSDLDRYCHYVAGTVGVMSTALFERYLQEQRRGENRFIATDAWREQGRRMGLGLQMTNIIKDAAGDAARGVSFVPPQYLGWTDSIPRLLTSARTTLVLHTLTHLNEAIAYTTSLPIDETGIRTFLLGSILPAIATLELAARGRPEDSKIGRPVMSSLVSFIERNTGNNASILSFYAESRERCIEQLFTCESETGVLRGPEEFFAGFLNQDWDLDAETPDDVIQTYCEDKKGGLDFIWTLELIHDLNELGEDEATLARALWAFGCHYLPTGNGWTSSSWLEHVEQLLQAAKLRG